MKKIYLFLVITVMFPLLDSCDSILGSDDISCSGSGITYYDYSSLELIPITDEATSNEYFYFYVFPDDQVFTSKLEEGSDYGASLYATALRTEPIYDVKSINITSNLPFDSSKSEELDLSPFLEIYKMGAWLPFANAQFVENLMQLRCTRLPDDLDNLYVINQ